MKNQSLAEYDITHCVRNIDNFSPQRQLAYKLKNVDLRILFIDHDTEEVGSVKPRLGSEEEAPHSGVTEAVSSHTG